MTDTTIARPPFDPEVGAALAVWGDQLPSTITIEMLPGLRSVSAGLDAVTDEMLAEAGLTARG